MNLFNKYFFTFTLVLIASSAQINAVRYSVPQQVHACNCQRHICSSNLRTRVRRAPLVRVVRPVYVNAYVPVVRCYPRLRPFAGFGFGFNFFL